MFRQGIFDTGRTTVREDVPVRERCLVQGLVLVREVIG